MKFDRNPRHSFILPDRPTSFCFASFSHLASSWVNLLVFLIFIYFFSLLCTLISYMKFERISWLMHSLEVRYFFFFFSFFLYITLSAIKSVFTDMLYDIDLWSDILLHETSISTNNSQNICQISFSYFIYCLENLLNLN